MFKKLLLSILCLSTLSSQAAPWINAKLLYPFIAAQTAAAAGYYFNNAYKNHKQFEFEKREDVLSKWTPYQESSSFALANDFYKIPAQESTDQNGDYQLKCQALQNIRDRLESKVHEVQKSTNNKQIKLVITPSLSNKHFTELLKEFEQDNKQPPENIYTLILNDFEASHGCIINLPLKEIAKLYKLSDEKTNRAYENHLQKIYAILGHELSHLENNDIESKIMATATIPFATEGIWQIGAKLLKRKPSPTHLSAFQFLYKTIAQLPIGAAKIWLTGILLSYYIASQEYRCDRQSIEYMGIESTPVFIKWFESQADKQKQNIEDYFNNGSPLGDQVINYISIRESGHPSNKYRAERLKKLLELEKQK